MRRVTYPLIAVLSLFAIPNLGQAHAAPVRAPACQAAGYSHADVQCVVVPAKGKFTIHIPGETDVLKGKGSKKTKGTQISIIHIPAPVSPKGGYGLRLRATGKFSPLHLSSGSLFRFNPAANDLVSVRAITASGIYQVVH